MSTVGVQQTAYKVFEPTFHSRRPIIVDEGIESPETVSLRYEEEAAIANGEDLRGQSLSDFLPMAAYKTQPAQLHGFADAAYTPYSQQQYHSQQTDDSAAHLDGLGFSTDDGTGQFLDAAGSQPPSPVNILSCGPTAGIAGTRVELKVMSQYDLMAMSSPAPYVWLSFGSQKCHTHVVKEAVSQDGLTYAVSAEAPQFMVTNCASPSSVPLTVVIENTNGEEMARVPVARSFTYHDAPEATEASASAPALDGVAAGDAAVSVSVSAEPEGITRKSPTQSPGHVEGHEGQLGSPPQLTMQTSATGSPSQAHSQLSSIESTTNSYSYPSSAVDAATAAATAAAAAAQHVQQADNTFSAAVSDTAYTQDNGTMLGTYRSASFSDGLPRAAAPPPLRTSLNTPTWTATSYGGLGHYQGQYQHHHQHHRQHHHAYNNTRDRYNTGRSHSVAHIYGSTPITRAPLSAPLPAPSNGNAPQLIRTSTIQTGPAASVGGGGGGMGANGGYGNGQWGGFPTKASLSIMGNLDAMAHDWTSEEWNNRRRIVLFRKKQNGSQLEMTFRAVPINERPPNSICISCIYWAEKQECFVTSVDTINLLEQLVAAPSRFSVEEKNRIRRNLEGFKPFTVSKAKAESEEFFKLIMAFGAPKPRTIEKDVKVFPWKILGPALKKIISKYSASPSSILPPASSVGAAQSHHSHLLTPMTMSPSYSVLPPTPGPLPTTTDGTSTVGYVAMTSGGANPADTLASPRSLSGASWVSYTGNTSSGRALSPGSTATKPQSPSSASLRLGTLLTGYDTRGSVGVSTPSTHSYGHPQQQHQAHSFNSPLSVATTAAAAAASLPPATTTAAAGGHGGNRWDGYGVTTSAAPSYSNNHHHNHHQQHAYHGHLYSTGYGDNVQRA
ncbi:transcriptional regulator medusa [Niveomyces insectorum RCEF 264]|uniref:Transcriptional regulator medusa n=1 Tax=Niveomyces insectorum RCEF 264 TaxID=1081102 RepID=A0A162JAE4_9HYPO|nr:transcriptional regulator medusa [Niveomyces insectorum RCEF 264]